MFNKKDLFNNNYFGRHSLFYGWQPFHVIISVVLILSVATWLLWMVFDTEEYQIRVDKITASYTGQWKENYSETVSGIDMEGKMYTETDHWEEDGGIAVSLTVQNNVVIHKSGECEIINPGAMAVCRKNKKWNSPRVLKHNSSFDNHSWEDSHTYSMYLQNAETNLEERKNLTASEYFYLSNNIGEMVTVKVNHFGSIFIKF